MAWSNPPPAVSALRDMLVACPAAVSAGLVQANIHYPAAVAESDDATAADAMPRAILGQMDSTPSPYCERGVAPLPGGTLTIVLHADNDAGTMETLAAALAAELPALSTGLHIRGTPTTQSIDPSPGQRAADETTGDTSSKFRAVLITVEHGLQP